MDFSTRFNRMMDWSYDSVYRFIDVGSIAASLPNTFYGDFMVQLKNVKVFSEVKETYRNDWFGVVDSCFKNWVFNSHSDLSKIMTSPSSLPIVSLTLNGLFGGSITMHGELYFKDESVVEGDGVFEVNMFDSFFDNIFCQYEGDIEVLEDTLKLKEDFVKLIIVYCDAYRPIRLTNDKSIIQDNFVERNDRVYHDVIVRKFEVRLPENIYI